jgi:hypothetical protein
MVPSAWSAQHGSLSIVASAWCPQHGAKPDTSRVLPLQAKAQGMPGLLLSLLSCAASGRGVLTAGSNLDVDAMQGGNMPRLFLQCCRQLRVLPGAAHRAALHVHAGLPSCHVSDHDGQQRGPQPGEGRRALRYAPPALSALPCGQLPLDAAAPGSSLVGMAGAVVSMLLHASVPPFALPGLPLHPHLGCPSPATLPLSCAVMHASTLLDAVLNLLQLPCTLRSKRSAAPRLHGMSQ